MKNRKKTTRGKALLIVGKKRLKASTLAEVLVAIAVCMLVFSFSMMILLKVDRENNMRLKLKADLIQEQMIGQLRNEDLVPVNDTLRAGALTIYRSITPVENEAGLMEVTSRVFSKSGTPLAVKQFLVTIKTKADEQDLE